jgi:pyridoxal phosphate enzyme (YggS family)
MNEDSYKKLISKLHEKKVTLVAVSKTKPVEAIQHLYAMGQRDFGENYVQELVDKYNALPKDIRWHFIGHLQTNKVKYIASFVHLIHSVDSEKLLKEIDKQGKKHNRIVNCLLQVYIAKEETKFGLDFSEAEEILKKVDANQNVSVVGLMGMASNTEDNSLIEAEFRTLNTFFHVIKSEIANPKFEILSMGMSADYGIAINQGSNMVRIGSMLFGSRK